MIDIQESILGKESQVALNEIKEIRLKAAKIRKKSWEMIKYLEPKIEELGKKIERLINRNGGILNNL